MEYIFPRTFYINSSMSSKPIYVDTSYLTEEQKFILEIESIIARKSKFRLEELKQRLMKLSIVSLDNDEREVLDYWGEEWD